jgi:succinyl-diaminopimelate desuccinylase
MGIKKLVNDILAIKSPTFHEHECLKFCEKWITTNTSLKITRIQDNLIASSPSSEKPHFAFVGHLDVIPEYFTPTENNGHIYGAGASDMKGGLAGFLWFIKENEQELLNKYQLSIILYSREEGTKIEDNGLYEVIQNQHHFLQTIDLAIIAEPTNNTIQLGCVGSIHATITIPGKAAHSARPWDGENALYNAVPVIDYFSKIKPYKHNISGVTFTDVISITESQTEKGRTTIPGYWCANINLRYSPTHDNGEEILINHCKKAGVNEENIEVRDHAPAGNIINSEVLEQTIKQLSQPIEAKQAWTDVAQLSQLGIPAFNFGPGLTEQAHKPNEYIEYKMLRDYVKILERLI